MKIFAFLGRRGVSMRLTVTVTAAACALLAASAQAAGRNAVVLPAMEGAAPHVFVNTSERATAKPPLVVSESASALLLKQQATRAVAVPDDRETPFPRAWMLGLLAVLSLVIFDRIRLAMKLAKLNQDASRSSGLGAPFARK